MHDRHDVIHYDPIQGQGQGHETQALKSGKSFRYLLRHLQRELAAGNWPRILKLGHNN